MAERDRRATWLTAIVGFALFAAAAGWTYVSSAGRPDARPRETAVLIAGAAIALACAWIVGSAARWIVPAAVIVAVGTFGLMARSPHAAVAVDPLGYSNASAALYLQGVVAGLMLAVSVRWTAVRVLGALAAIGFVVLTVRADSQAVTVLLVLPAAALAFGLGGHARAGVATAGGLVAAALCVSIVLGATYVPGRSDPIDRLVNAGLSARRPALWHDAIVLMKDHPKRGVGSGRFAVTSPIALSDQDARWAHNGFLQQGAEGGLPGFLVLVLIFGWGFAALWRKGGDAYTALAAASLAALGVQACIDYVLHFPALPLVVAALVGAALGAPALRPASAVSDRDSADSAESANREHELARP